MRLFRRILVGDLGLLTGATVIGLGLASMMLLFGGVAAAEATRSMHAVPWRLAVFSVGFVAVWGATAIVLLGGGFAAGAVLSVAPHLGLLTTRALSGRVPVLVRGRWLDLTFGYVLVGLIVTAGALLVRELFDSRNETHNPADA